MAGTDLLFLLAKSDGLGNEFVSEISFRNSSNLELGLRDDLAEGRGGGGGGGGIPLFPVSFSGLTVSSSMASYSCSGRKRDKIN